MNCSSGCTTGPHATYGECLRAKSMRVAYCQSASGADATEQKHWDRNLDNYRKAVKSGMEPASTTPAAVRAAVEWSNKTGIAYSESNYMAHKKSVAAEINS